MVTNSTNINKTNNLPIILTELTEHKKTTTYDVGNPGPGLGQVQNTLLYPAYLTHDH
jgi:hypothetical protein